MEETTAKTHSIKSLTKEGFLNGQKFSVRESLGERGYFHYEKPTDKFSYGSLYIGDEYFCLVKNITKSGFTFCKSLFGKLVRGRVPFSRCYYKEHPKP